MSSRRRYPRFKSRLVRVDTHTLNLISHQRRRMVWLQVLGVIKNWLEEHWIDFEEDENLRKQLEAFIKALDEVCIAMLQGFDCDVGHDRGLVALVRTRVAGLRSRRPLSRSCSTSRRRTARTGNTCLAR